MDKIITIGREFGSGGREIGLKVANLLKVPFYDKELISVAAEQGELSPEFLNEFEESVVRAPLFSPRTGLFSIYQQSMTDKIFLAQFHIIKSLAQQGPCVIVGRCADYVLKKQAVNIFVHADISARVQRKLSLDIGVPENKMEQHILATDKKRQQYYQHYTDQVWGDARNYQLCIDTTDVGVDGGVDLALCYLKYLKGL